MDFSVYQGVVRMKKNSVDMTKYRILAMLFSRKFFTWLLERGDIAPLMEVRQVVGNGRSRCRTAEEYLAWAYNTLLRHYPCEYVYKNEFLNRVVLKHRLGRDCVVVSEFKVAGAIADFAIFGEESCAFEIKTDLDSPKRLAEQLASYQTVFEKVSLVISMEDLGRYVPLLSPNIGLVGLLNDPCGCNFEEIRPAVRTEAIDPVELMKVLHTAEYERVVTSYCGTLPACCSFERYEACEKVLMEMPQDMLRQAFRDSVRRRRKRLQTMEVLWRAPRSLRQMTLSMGLTAADIDNIRQRLSILLGE